MVLIPPFNKQICLSIHLSTFSLHRLFIRLPGLDKESIPSMIYKKCIGWHFKKPTLQRLCLTWQGEYRFVSTQRWRTGRQAFKIFNYSTLSNRISHSKSCLLTAVTPKICTMVAVVPTAPPLHLGHSTVTLIGEGLDKVRPHRNLFCVLNITEDWVYCD